MKFALSVFLAVQLAAAEWYVPADLEANPRAGCDYVLTTQSGNITSPGFPNNYAANLNCSWLFFIPSGQSVRLNFTSFLLEQNFDFVRVSFIHLLSCS
jgi:CUB domain